MWRNNVQTHKAPDFLRLQKNKKCLFPLIKGCVGYICSGLFLGLKESTCETRKNVFCFKSTFCSQENQSLEYKRIQIS